MYLPKKFSIINIVKLLSIMLSITILSALMSYGDIYLFEIMLLFFAGLIFLIFCITLLINTFYKINKADKTLKILQGSTKWDIIKIKDRIKKVVLNLETDLTEKNIQSIKKYSTNYFTNKTQNYFEKKLNGKRYIINKTRITSIDFVGIKYNKFIEQGDMFACKIEGRRIEYLIDDISGKFISSMKLREKYESKKDYIERVTNTTDIFIEYLLFININSQWLLYDIRYKLPLFSNIINLSEQEISNIINEESARKIL